MTQINKELSMKEKAEAYNRALEIAKAWCKLDNNDLSNDDLKTLFPELKEESEDEKIRKDIISYIKAIVNNKNISPDSKKECKTWIFWLEKQGEQKPPIEMKTAEESLGIDTKTYTEIVDECIFGDRPKFKVGDWIIFNGLTLCINDVVKGYYRTKSINGIPCSYDWDIDNIARLWSIKDAKDGDVLCDCHEAYDNPLIFILKKFEHINFGLVRPSDYSSYCFLTAGDEQKFKKGTYHHKHNIKPATKEQRDILFQRMHEAGYSWDPGKKELKRTEQESTDEPKFKRRDWITNGRYAKLIVGINSDWPHYMFEDGTSKRIKDIDKKYHLWTIKDAKPGDVLVDEDNNTGIYKEIEDTWWNSYIYLGCNNCLYGPGIGGMHGQNSTKPATKERRDLLFSKMKEAGYEWDPGKKELKKIEQEPTDKIRPKFKVGDRIIKSSRNSCSVHSSTDDTICEVAEVHDTCYILNTGEGRIQVPLEWQDNYELVKPTWSEEDETNKLSEEDINNLNRISTILYEAGQVQCWWREKRLIPKEESDYLCNWLKSLYNKLKL